MDEQIKSEAGAKMQDSSDIPKETKKNGNHAHTVDKRSRLITSSIMAVIILSVISVVVFGIFQLTIKMRIVCPAEIPVNDPAPVLWQDIVSEQIRNAKLGVSDKAQAVYLKGMPIAESKTK